MSVSLLDADLILEVAQANTDIDPVLEVAQATSPKKQINVPAKQVETGRTTKGRQRGNRRGGSADHRQWSC